MNSNTHEKSGKLGRVDGIKMFLSLRLSQWYKELSKNSLEEGEKWLESLNLPNFDCIFLANSNELASGTKAGRWLAAPRYGGPVHKAFQWPESTSSMSSCAWKRETGNWGSEGEREREKKKKRERNEALWAWFEIFKKLGLTDYHLSKEFHSQNSEKSLLKRLITRVGNNKNFGKQECKNR